MRFEVPAAGTSRWALEIWGTAGALVIAALFLTNWPTYQYVVLGGAPPIWYYALPTVVLVPIFFARPEAILRVCQEPLLWWYLFYVVSGAVWLLLSQSFMEDASQQWRLRVLAFFFFFSTAVIASESRRGVVYLVIVAAICVSSIFNWWDALRPNLFVPVGIEGGTAGRGAGLFINSNAAAAFVLAATVVLLAFVPMHMRGALLLLTFVGIVPTFSRSGLVCAALVVVLAVGLKLVNRTQVVALLIALPLLAGGTAIYYDSLLSSSDDTNLHRIVQRLNWFQDMQSDDSIEDRIYPALRAWEMFLDAPVLGNGVGVTSRPSLGDGTHNMYLLLMAEQGVVGLMLYLSLVALLAKRGWRVWQEASSQPSADLGKTMVLYATFIAAWGFFSHNVLEEPHGIFLMAFLASAAFAAGSSPPSIERFPEARRGYLQRDDRLLSAIRPRSRR
jgi:O-antigen ligase